MVSFLLEVGTEELPASFVRSAIAQWREKIAASLAEVNLAAGRVQVYGTPRRLAVYLSDLPERQPDRAEEIKGPPASIAYNDGKPTQALLGFARKQAIDLDAIALREVGKKGKFVFATKYIEGKSTPELLQQLVPQWIAGLEAKRAMRWGNGEFRFPRPIRWLVALWGDRVLPLEIEAVSSGRTSQAHRVLHPEPLDIASPEAYVETLKSGFVQVDREQRQASIVAQVQAVAETANSVASMPADLLEEVTDLVEWPTAVLGSFEEEFLELPVPVIKSVMVEHQRYFSLHPADRPAELVPYFITISNGDPAQAEEIAAGNGRVIRARLEDGRFFYNEDRKQPLDAFVDRLEQVTFEQSLGSVLAKVKRIEQISGWIARQLQLNRGDTADVLRAAHLCKADLVTQMVYEFPEMQGVIGRDYALQGGESAAVADGIEQHYWPLGAGDRLPIALAGQVVGLADRIDSLVGLFSIGKIPSGSSDRFALRRAANSILSIAWQADLEIDLLALFVEATSTFASDPPATFNILLEFFGQRVQTLLQEDFGLDYDLIDAVVEPTNPEKVRRSLQDLQGTLQRAQYLQQLRRGGTLELLYPTVNRTARLAEKGDLAAEVLDPAAAVDASRLQEPAEKNLFAASQSIYARGQTAVREQNYTILVQALLEAAPAVAAFFDEVLVMDKDPAVRTNRLNLLCVLRNNAGLLADFGAVVMAGES
ncbi:glycine--tRNA ligase subunit beta [Synechococcus sp. PCC 7336]|uniref:glycine--tRNA ligase subunit beta n=1 Tax=Synechococcus sp. PCC 7336 TaxID=195250 RepID=UPI000346F6C0|nr:glycine--tRNA ligase subunit beta [Synechococcus sp. PCC 7336]